MDDLFQWVWNVIYKNGGSIELSELTDLLYNASKKWFNIINNTFGDLHLFLGQYPSDFFFTVNRGILIVSIATNRQQRSLPVSRPSSGYSAHSRHDSLNSTTDENRSHSSQKSFSPYQNPSLPQEFGTKSNLRYVIDFVISVLSNSAECQMKAVELANAICHKFGSAVLTSIRETHGGLLNLLEEYSSYFRVVRIPKNDLVMLVRPGQEPGFSSSRGSISVPIATTPHSPPRVSPSEVSNSRGTSRCLHLGNVGIRSSEQDIRDEFGAFGCVEDVKIVHQGDRRYAFVYFSNVSEAEAAKAILSKHSKWKGNISYAKKEKDISERRARVSTPNRHLWIGNIGHEVDESSLRAIFGRFGTIENVTILEDKGCAFVDFEEEQSAVRAQQQKGMMIEGNLVELGFGKMDERTNGAQLLGEKDRNALLCVFTAIMGTLRFREKISLTEMFDKIAASEEFRSRRIDVSDMMDDGSVMRDGSESKSTLQRNLDFLKSVLLSSSAMYVLQEDPESHQLYFSNNSLPGKSQDDQICIDFLEDLLFSNLNLVCWPRYQRRDCYLINLIKQLLIQHNGSVDLDTLAKDIVNNLFYINKPMNIQALREFFKSYNSILSVNNDVVSILGA